MAPKIDRRNLRDVTLSAGSLLRFDANVIGEPPPHIEWRYGAIPLHSDRKVQIDNSEYSTKFSIRPVVRDDSGDYTVTATNSSGRDSVTVQVTVTDKPMPPEGPLQVSDVHKEGCKLKWKRPKDDGGTPIEYYQVDKMDPETGCWVPCGRSTEPSKSNLRLLLFHGRTNLNVSSYSHRFGGNRINAGQGISVPSERGERRGRI